MKAECGSHTYVYVPFRSVTFQLQVPIPPVVVDRSTPGPLRWKSWSPALSFTTIVYLPAFRLETFFPWNVSEMFTGSETEPWSFGAAAAPFPATVAATATTTPSMPMRFMRTTVATRGRRRAREDRHRC